MLPMWLVPGGHYSLLARQQAEQLAAGEPHSLEFHDLGLVALAVVLPLERNMTVIHCYQPLIGNRHPMGIPAKILLTPGHAGSPRGET